MRVCNCSMFCCTLLYVHSSFAIILMGKRKLVALLSLSSCCFLMVVWLFLAVPWVYLLFVIVVFPDHTNYILGSEYPLYLLYINHKTGYLETWLHHWIVSMSWKCPWSVPYRFGIWSWNNFAITKSDCNYCLPILICRQRCNRYWNISSEILVCRPGSNPLCRLSVGALANNQLFTIWYMQQHGSQ